jgi:hypothetical protein
MYAHYSRDNLLLKHLCFIENWQVLHNMFTLFITIIQITVSGSLNKTTKIGGMWHNNILPIVHIYIVHDNHTKYSVIISTTTKIGGMQHNNIYLVSNILLDAADTHQVNGYFSHMVTMYSMCKDRYLKCLYMYITL